MPKTVFSGAHEHLVELLVRARRKAGLTQTQLAELIDVDLDPYRHRILINQGERHGVFVGQAVIDANGLVGQVLDVEDARATVILLSDPSHAVPVRVQRSVGTARRSSRSRASSMGKPPAVGRAPLGEVAAPGEEERGGVWGVGVIDAPRRSASSRYARRGRTARTGQRSGQ